MSSQEPPSQPQQPNICAKCNLVIETNHLVCNNKHICNACLEKILMFDTNIVKIIEEKLNKIKNVL